jgi:hypothetical protein
MAHLPGSPDEVRARVPPVHEAWQYVRANVLLDGVVEPELKRLCFRFVAEDDETVDVGDFSERERLALRWAQAIAWDAGLADDAFWERLHAEFSEQELVELGCSIGFVLGQQHFERTLGLGAHAGVS